MKKALRLIFFLVPLFTINGQSTNLLDMTQKPVFVEKKVRGSGSSNSSWYSVGCGANGCKVFGPKKLPLKITLQEFEKSVYQVREEVIYEILLENISQEPVTIPWSYYREEEIRDRLKVEPEESRVYLETSVTLQIRELVDSNTSEVSKWRTLFSTVESIYGARAIVDSTKVLQSGETVKIRAVGKWGNSEESFSQEVPHGTSKIFEIAIKCDFAEARHELQPIMSENILTVELVKPAKQQPESE